MGQQASKQALKVTLTYVGVACGWIVFSDKLLARLVTDAEIRSQIGMFKGLAFVLTSGVLLYLALRRILRNWEQAVRKQQVAEGELVKAKAHYQNLLATSSDGIHVLDQDGRLMEANTAFYEMLGYSADSPPALSVQDWDAKWKGQELKDRLKLLFERPTMFETLHRRADGRIIHVEVNARRIEINGQPCIYASSRDATKRKLAEEALRESEEKFYKIFQSSPMAVALSTLEDGRYLDANDEFLKLAQRRRDDVVGHTAAEIGMWEDLQQRNAVVARVGEFETLRNLELRIRRPSGEVRQILWSAEAVQIGGKQCLLGTSLDITERQLAEEKHRESEQRYRQLFELESDAVFLIDSENRRLVDFNRSAELLYGYSRDELLEMTAESISAEPVNNSPELAGVRDQFVPLRWHRKKDGQRFAVEIASNGITYQGRRMELATVRDITSRHQVMEMLQETTEQLLEAQRVAGLGSYVFDTVTGLWTGSPVLGEIFGLQDPELPHDVAAWLQLIHPQDRDRMRRYLFEEVLQNHGIFDQVYRIVRLSDQAERWVHGLGKLVFDAQGNAIRMVGVIQDITKLKRDEELLRVQLSALTTAANAIVIADPKGTVTWVNPAFTKLTGYAAEEIIGNNVRLLKSGQHPPAFYANLWATILTGNVWHGEIINRRKDGQVYTEDMTITPVRGTDGQIVNFVAVKQDITEQRQLEKRMHHAQKMEAIGTLAGGIAHDFNNILAAMFGYAHLLKQDTDGNAVAQESIDEILKATGRAKDLVQQILTFSRQRDQKPQIVQLDTVIKEAIRFLRASMPAQIRIAMALDADAPAVLADPTQIYQVVINLATNALHAMEGHPGTLTVTLDSFKPDQVFTRSHPDFKAVPYARLTVADTGHGMDTKVLERIFEPFFTTKPVGKGTGLGLAVVHGIVESHQGLITVDSQVGRGTTFSLYFPGQSKEAAPAPKVDDRTPHGRGQRILLLDDEPALTGALHRLLTRLNYQVTASNHAREAVQWCRNNPRQFDLVITDLTMPEMTGVQVAQHIHAVRPDLPVLLASGFSADLDRESLRQAGVFELIEKPISRSILAEAVERALSARNGHSHNNGSHGLLPGPNSPHP
jgi:PAS domain S-box-containing protein